MRTKAPLNASEIVERLTSEFDTLSVQLQLAARYIIDQPREVGVQSMRALAVKAEVHPNTLVRLAQSIGFDGYDQMRDRFRDFIVSDGFGGYRDRAHWLREIARHGGSAEVIAQMAASTADNLDVMWRRQDAAQLEHVADLILGASRVYVLGMGSAYSLAHQFWYVARMGLTHIVPIPHRGSQPIDDVSAIEPGEMLIAFTFQPYRSETMQAVRHAKKRGALIIGVTDSDTSPLARISDETMIAPTHTPHFFESHAAVTALIEGLIAILIARAGDQADARIDMFHQLRLDAGLYEEEASLAKLG